MASHIRVLGLLNAILGGAGVVAAILVLDFLRTHGGAAAVAPGPVATFALAAMSSIFRGIVSTLGETAATLILVFSVPALIGGMGLLRMARWSRGWMMVVSPLQLLYVPVGTLLGGYGLWCLTRPEARELFARSGAPSLDRGEGRRQPRA